MAQGANTLEQLIDKTGVWRLRHTQNTRGRGATHQYPPPRSLRRLAEAKQKRMARMPCASRRRSCHTRIIRILLTPYTMSKKGIKDTITRKFEYLQFSKIANQIESNIRRRSSSYSSSLISSCARSLFSSSRRSEIFSLNSPDSIDIMLIIFSISYWVIVSL